MAWLLQGKCKFCAYAVGPIEDYAASIYFCRECKDYKTIEYIPRRFDLPDCENCGNQFSESDLVKDKGLTACPSCAKNGVDWEVIAHLNMAYQPEASPRLGDIVHGHIRNTGHIQRVEFANSNMRGRLGADQPEMEDGIAVEAEVVALGERSLDVVIIGALPNIKPMPREQVIAGNPLDAQ